MVEEDQNIVEEDQYPQLYADPEKWAEVQKYLADVEKEKTAIYSDIANNLIDSVKQYSEKRRQNITFMVASLIGLIFISMAYLTYLDKVGGETFAFVTGTIVGYIISLLKQN